MKRYKRLYVVLAVLLAACIATFALSRYKDQKEQIQTSGETILSISADLRQIALIIILTRAGLSLDIEGLKRAGRPAALLCFVPASFEMAGIVLLAPPLLGVSYLDAAVMGTVLAAVSPAVIVPKMLRLTEEKWGTKKLSLIHI